MAYHFTNDCKFAILVANMRDVEEDDAETFLNMSRFAFSVAKDGERLYDYTLEVDGDPPWITVKGHVLVVSNEEAPDGATAITVRATLPDGGTAETTATVIKEADPIDPNAVQLAAEEDPVQTVLVKTPGEPNGYAVSPPPPFVQWHLDNEDYERLDDDNRPAYLMCSIVAPE